MYHFSLDASYISYDFTWNRWFHANSTQGSESWTGRVGETVKSSVWLPSNIIKMKGAYLRNAHRLGQTMLARSSLLGEQPKVL